MDSRWPYLSDRTLADPVARFYPTRRGRAPRSPAALPAVELGDVEEQVAAGDPAAPPERRAGGAVEGVEGAGEDQPLGDRPADPGPGPEVAEVGVRLAGEDPGDLRFADALDVGEREPDAVRLRPLPPPGDVPAPGTGPHGVVHLRLLARRGGRTRRLRHLTRGVSCPVGGVLERLDAVGKRFFAHLESMDAR